MIFNENYCRACMERNVPTSILLHQIEQMEGKTDEEVTSMKEKFAKEIRETYPLKEKQSR